MFVEIDLETFDVIQEGFVSRALGPRTLYSSAGLVGLERIEQLREAEYAHRRWR